MCLIDFYMGNDNKQKADGNKKPPLHQTAAGKQQISKVSCSVMQM